MILDPSGQGQAVSQQLAKQAAILSMGERIFTQAVADYILHATDEEVAANLPGLAARAIGAAQVYIAVATAAAEPK